MRWNEKVILDNFLDYTLDVNVTFAGLVRCLLLYNY